MNLEFIVYFLCALALFVSIWKFLDWIEERDARRFKEKVDRYRRGNR